jgi:hypothetical protein
MLTTIPNSRLPNYPNLDMQTSDVNKSRKRKNNRWIMKDKRSANNICIIHAFLCMHHGVKKKCVHYIPLRVYPDGCYIIKPHHTTFQSSLGLNRSSQTLRSTIDSIQKVGFLVSDNQHQRHGIIHFNFDALAGNKLKQLFHIIVIFIANILLS